MGARSLSQENDWKSWSLWVELVLHRELALDSPVRCDLADVPPHSANQEQLSAVTLHHFLLSFLLYSICTSFEVAY